MKLSELAKTGGIKSAYKQIQNAGGHERRAYLYMCSRGRAHAMSARFFRKHGVRVPVSKIDPWHVHFDKLNERALDRWERTIEAHDKSDSRVILGGYRDDRYAGCGHCCHYIVLRTGGRSNEYGAFSTPQGQKYFNI